VNEDEQLLPSEVQIALQGCFAQIRLTRATELAQSGRYIEAEAILVQNTKLPDDPAELDLLARIAARQGRFDEARRRWNAAIQREPGNEIYKQCLERLTPARRIIRLIGNAQDTFLLILAWATVAFGMGVLVVTFFRK
jgi:tetratricopeptide (TPR) repeat protein